VICDCIGLRGGERLDTRRDHEIANRKSQIANGFEMPLEAYLTLAAVLFCIGLFGVVTRRNTIGILLGIELMLNAVNINLIALARFRGDVTGMVFTVFTICITVSEAALGLAIVILLFRIRRTVIADHLDLLKG
jgi:NADH-quinone oxidoreductase subunit K